VKPFWDNLFYDMRECGLSEEDFAKKAGKEILDDLHRIEMAIRTYKGREALDLIAQLRNDY
jgi:hypothetical protein